MVDPISIDIAPSRKCFREDGNFDLPIWQMPISDHGDAAAVWEQFRKSG
jgi:hypothetical protein